MPSTYHGKDGDCPSASEAILKNMSEWLTWTDNTIPTKQATTQLCAHLWDKLYINY